MTLIRKDRTYRGKPTHSYELDGVKVQGVTTLLSKGLPKPALPPWAAKSVAEYVADNADAVRSMLDTMGRESIVGALKGVPWDKRDEAAARGTEIHAIAEKVIAGADVDVPEHLIGYVQGYVDWLDAWQVTANLTEVTVGRRPEAGVPAYAGTFDADVTMGAGPLAGKRGLVDWKTAKGVYGENGLQLAAYANAHFYLDPDDGSEKPMPVYDFLGVVHVTPTGTDLYVVQDPAACWRIFRHVAYVAEQVDVVKAQITDPTPMPTLGDAA
jgi:hypothetical protein